MRTLALLAAVLAPVLVACGGADEVVGAPAGEESDVTGTPSAKPGSPAQADPGAAAQAEPGASAAPGAVALGACVAMPSCDGAKGPTLGPPRAWAHTTNSVVARVGNAYHRGRDHVMKVGTKQVVIGKFTYGLADVDIEDEEVDVFVERGCDGSWEKLGTTTTTFAGDHVDVDGVSDSGGRVYFEVPAAKQLAPGRHRVRMVVAADHTFADAILDVVPNGAPVFVSDVDGTLTETENAEFASLLQGTDPAANPRAADALSALAARGIRPVYLSARPEWLVDQTHAWLKKEGFPPGIVITTTGLTGLFGDSARDFKTAALARLAAEGVKITWAIGNTTSDQDAYEAAEVKPVDHRVFLRLTDPHGGRRIEAYSELLPLTTAQPATCK
jgi:phosphoserine phosphatase